MPKAIIFLFALTILLCTNNTALAIGDCKNLMKSVSVDAEMTDMMKLAKISLSCDSKDELVCKQSNRSFSCETIETKLDENIKVFQKYRLAKFIANEKLNTPVGYKKKLKEKPISLGRKDTKTFCSFIETENYDPCKMEKNYLGSSVDGLMFSYSFILDPKGQAYVYAYETTELAFGFTCDVFSNKDCSSHGDDVYVQDLMKKSKLLALINKKSK